MTITDLSATANAWSFLAKDIVVPRTEHEYQNLVSTLDKLIDEVGEDETHPLASLMEVIGVLIENYETNNVPELI